MTIRCPECWALYPSDKRHECPAAAANAAYQARATNWRFERVRVGPLWCEQVVVILDRLGEKAASAKVVADPAGGEVSVFWRERVGG